jgi:hypothetical protein
MAGIKLFSMTKKKTTHKTNELPVPEPAPDVKKQEEPVYPLTAEEELDVIPDEDPFENPPVETPPPGEGP